MGWNALHQSAMEGKADEIHYEIYENGVIVKESTDLTGMTPLHKACQYGQVRAVEELIKEGADVLARNNWEATALHWACKGFIHNQKDARDEAQFKADYIQIINMLLAQNKKLLFMENKMKQTPFQVANSVKGAEEIAGHLDKRMDLVRRQKDEADQKRIRNKPKVRRL